MVAKRDCPKHCIVSTQLLVTQFGAFLHLPGTVAFRLSQTWFSSAERETCLESKPTTNPSSTCWRCHGCPTKSCRTPRNARRLQFRPTPAQATQPRSLWCVSPIIAAVLGSETSRRSCGSFNLKLSCSAQVYRWLTRPLFSGQLLTTSIHSLTTCHLLALVVPY